MNNWITGEGAPNPFGVTFIENEGAYNFALYSKHASGVTLHLCSETDPEHPLYSYAFNYLQNKSGRIWHCRVATDIVNQAKYYGYQVNGPHNLHEGHRFDPDELRNEFRDMVMALHQADIEVILDVVYNPTGEGEEHGPTYSFRGIDNTTYLSARR